MMSTARDDVYAEVWPRLFGLAYRMTGSVADAEDIVQDAWMRRLRVDGGAIQSDIGWLIRTVSTIAIDHLRRDRRLRRGGPGTPLPEPLADERLAPDQMAASRENIGYAVLLLLDRLTPEQRVVWVLRESLGLSYEAIGNMLDKTPAACRQIFRRASVRVAPERDPPETGAISTAQLNRFLAALQCGDAAAVAAILADDAVWMGDGGKERLAVARPVVGADKVARGLTGLVKKHVDASWSFAVRQINGGPAIVVLVDGEPDSCWMVLGDGERITHVLSQRDLAKLTGLDADTTRGSGEV